VSAAALGLALAAACLHAVWNVLLGGARDVLAATAVALTTSVVAAAPLAALTWDVEARAVPFIVASGVLQLAYFFLLARAYQEADVSVVYPVARGGAPVLVLLGGLAVGDMPTALAAAGVVLVALGVLAVRSRDRADSRGLVLGAAVAACIAGYTLVDAEGIEHATPVAYLELGLLPVAAASLLATRGSRFRAELGTAAVVAGLFGFAAYCLVLAALRLAPAAAVAAVRETSVVIAVALAGVLLGEAVGRRRLLGAALVVAGVLLLAV
jgi:drug/metabolite transporter (DMT)-like permease